MNVTMCVNACVCVGVQLGSEMCRCLCMHACVCYYYVHDIFVSYNVLVERQNNIQ